MDARVWWIVSCLASAMWIGCGDPGSSASPPDGSTPADAPTGSVDIPSVEPDGEDGTAAPQDAGPSDPTAPTWHGGVEALMSVHCVGCHQAGSIAPFALDTYEDAVIFGAAAAAATSAGSMPPWPPGEGCRDMLGERRLTEEEIALLVAWVEAGSPLGEPVGGEGPGPSVDPLGPADLVTDPGSDYTPDVNLPDDWRCLVLDQTFNTDTLVRAVDIYPGSATVHHVLVYVVAAEDVGQLEALEVNDPGEGYQCFGGPVVGGGNMLSGWVPGGQAVQAPEGSAFIIEAGSRIVMQVHYSMVGYDAQSPPPPDRTAIAFWLLEEGVVPSHVLRFGGYPHGDIFIEADDPQSIQQKIFDLNAGPTIVGIAPHMHLLGTSISVALQPAVGEEECLVDIADWDFGWQQIYQFTPEAHRTVQPGDRLALTCVYDNSASNQPVVNGVQLSPTAVTWGESTFDEMCLAYLLYKVPYVPPGQSPCAALAPCIAACESGGSECIYGCFYEVVECTDCLTDGIGACGEQHCADGWSDIVDCVGGCQQAGAGGCLAWNGVCHDAFEVFVACMEPHLRQGACDGFFETSCADVAGG